MRKLAIAVALSATLLATPAFARDRSLPATDTPVTRASVLEDMLVNYQRTYFDPMTGAVLIPTVWNGPTYMAYAGATDSTFTDDAAISNDAPDNLFGRAILAAAAASLAAADPFRTVNTA